MVLFRRSRGPQAPLQPRHPARTLIAAAAAVILLGGWLLQLPAFSRPGAVSPSAAWFTATSAVCVTGLTVVDTSRDFTPLGQVLILVLIQIGGLGYMTASTVTAVLMRRQPNLHDRLLLCDTLGQVSLADASRLFRRAVKFTLAAEAVGAAILALRFAQDPGRALPEALWLGLANAVSAFCNADFVWLGAAGAPGSLGPYRDDLAVNLTLSALVITGGLGFAVCYELARARRHKPLTLQCRVVLVTTAVLLLGGTLAFLLAEGANPETLGPLPLPEKVLAAFFNSMAVRTAGFSTVDFGRLQSVTLLVLSVLMFIGASPGGTGGGVKTTTLAVTIAAIRASLRERTDVELFCRRIPTDVVYRALVLLFLSALVVLAASLGLTCSETAGLEAAGIRGDLFLRLQFEAASAFATAGISTGITPLLSEAGRFVLMLLMFLGRLGPMTVATAYALPREAARRRYAEERIPLG